MDAKLGRCLALLKKHGVEENTLVLFMSDHGLISLAEALCGAGDDDDFCFQTHRLAPSSRLVLFADPPALAIEPQPAVRRADHAGVGDQSAVAAPIVQQTGGRLKVV